MLPNCSLLKTKRKKSLRISLLFLFLAPQISPFSVSLIHSEHLFLGPFPSLFSWPPEVINPKVSGCLQCKVSSIQRWDFVEPGLGPLGLWPCRISSSWRSDCVAHTQIIKIGNQKHTRGSYLPCQDSYDFWLTFQEIWAQ